MIPDNPLRPFFLGGAVALLLAGCAAPTTDRRFPGRELIRLWHPWSADGEPIVQAIADRFNSSQTRYEVVPLGLPGGVNSTKFMLAVSGGDPPDVLATWDPVLPLWARERILQPLDGMMSPKDRAAYAGMYPIARKVGTVGGHVYGLPVGLNVAALYYRPADLAAAGLPVRDPRTLEEVAEWSARLTRRKPDGSLARMGLMPGELRDVAPLFGGGYAEGRLDTPENRRALRWLTRERERLGFERYIRFQVGIGLDSSGGSAEASWPLISGRYSMAMDGQWRVEQVGKYAPAFAKAYRVAPIPPPQGGVRGAGYAVSTLLVVPTGSKHAKGAWEFARFWSGLRNPEVAAEMNVLGGWLPSSARMAQAPAYAEYVRRYPQFRTFMGLLPSPHLQTAPAVPYQPYLLDAAGKADWSAVSGARRPDAALAKAQADLDRELARRRKLGEPL